MDVSEQPRAAERLLIISSDGHVGPPVEDFRPYIDPEHQAAFNDWVAGYEPVWMATRAKNSGERETLSETYKREWMSNEKVAEGARGTWDPLARLASLDADGIAADVLFPDEQSANSPPFMWFARGYDRRPDEEYSPALRLAGARAYNRWLADFCASDPERLRGLALIGSMADVPGAVAEITRAKQSGLNGGVLLPLIYYNSPEEPFWNDRRYDPIWAVCQELNMPIHTHTGAGHPWYGDTPEAPVLFALECTMWPHRPLTFLIAGGVFERFPGLKLVLTEQGSAWVIQALAMLDHGVADKKYAFGEGRHLALKPSEYFRRQCWLGSSIVHRTEIEARHVIGVDKMMWGWDYPHIESADWLTPRANLRRLMQGVPANELKAMLAGNALDAYSLDETKFSAIAARIGPELGELLTA
jgi:predicted TIM-barrel fold metal-dependent hydrolase